MSHPYRMSPATGWGTRSVYSMHPENQRAEYRGEEWGEQQEQRQRQRQELMQVGGEVQGDITGRNMPWLGGHGPMTEGYNTEVGRSSSTYFPQAGPSSSVASRSTSQLPPPALEVDTPRLPITPRRRGRKSNVRHRKLVEYNKQLERYGMEGITNVYTNAHEYQEEVEKMMRARQEKERQERERQKREREEREREEREREERKAWEIAQRAPQVNRAIVLRQMQAIIEEKDWREGRKEWHESAQLRRTGINRNHHIEEHHLLFSLPGNDLRSNDTFSMKPCDACINLCYICAVLADDIIAKKKLEATSEHLKYMNAYMTLRRTVEILGWATKGIGATSVMFILGSPKQRMEEQEWELEAMKANIEWLQNMNAYLMRKELEIQEWIAKQYEMKKFSEFAWGYMEDMKRREAMKMTNMRTVSSRTNRHSAYVETCLEGFLDSQPILSLIPIVIFIYGPAAEDVMLARILTNGGHGPNTSSFIPYAPAHIQGFKIVERCVTPFIVRCRKDERNSSPLPEPVVQGRVCVLSEPEQITRYHQFSSFGNRGYLTQLDIYVHSSSDWNTSQGTIKKGYAYVADDVWEGSEGQYELKEDVWYGAEPLHEIPGYGIFDFGDSVNEMTTN